MCQTSGFHIKEYPDNCSLKSNATWLFGWCLVALARVKWPGRGVDHPPLPSAEVKVTISTFMAWYRTNYFYVDFTVCRDMTLYSLVRECQRSKGNCCYQLLDRKLKHAGNIVWI